MDREHGRVSQLLEERQGLTMTIAEMGLELQHRGDDIRTLVQAYRDLDAYWDNRLWWAEDDGKRWATNSFADKCA